MSPVHNASAFRLCGSPLKLTLPLLVLLVGKALAAETPVVTEIIVTGERPDVETRVDRKVYAVSHDLQAPLGNATDVLRNVPSVDIDIEGNPSLRGDAEVTILIDGRPAPQFNGNNRGSALEQFSAADIDRIEVITNPPANFKREGTAGIINIITKRSSRARSASARASAGNGGRYALGTSQGVRLGDWNLRGNAGLRHDLRIRDITEQRILRDPNGATLTERQFEAHGEDDRISKTVGLGTDYEFDEQNRLSADAGYYRRDARGAFDERTEVRDGAGAPTSLSSRSRRSDQYEYSSEVGLSWHRDGARDGDTLDVAWRRSDEVENDPFDYVDSSSLPAVLDTFQRQVFAERELEHEFSIESVRTLDAGVRWIAGYELSHDQNAFDSTQTLAVEAGEPMPIDPDFTNSFDYRQTIHAAYTSYERPFGKWTWLGGVRLEQADVGLAQDYFRAYPTLHVAKKLDDERTLTFSYSRRVSRPDYQELVPFRWRVDAFAFRQGNPNLRPTLVDSVEAGWSRERHRSSLSATLYARRSRDNVTWVTTPLSETVVLHQPENVGETTAGGLELAASGRLTSWMDFRLSGNLYYSELDADNLGFDEERSTTTYAAKAAMNWKAGARNSGQINVVTTGKQLTPQGYRQGSTMLDLGYRFAWRPNLALVLTVTDLFDSRRDRTVLDTPELSSSSEMRQQGRIGFIGLSWTLPNAREQGSENFEYGE